MYRKCQALWCLAKCYGLLCVASIPRAPPTVMFVHIPWLQPGIQNKPSSQDSKQSPQTPVCCQLDSTFALPTFAVASLCQTNFTTAPQQQLPARNRFGEKKLCGCDVYLKCLRLAWHQRCLSGVFVRNPTKQSGTMLALTTVVAVAVSCGVLFIVCSVVGTIVWVRIRQEKLSMAMANARTGRYARGLQNFPAETVTELSPEEGATLGQYGQLPYGNPTEWALIESRERLLNHKVDAEMSPELPEKARSLRHSLSRSKSKRASKGGLRRPPRLSSLATLGETSEKQPSEPRGSISKDDVSVSAVEGVMELPAETSPRQTPDREEGPPGRSSGSTNLQSTPTYSVFMNRDYPSSLFPVREDQEGFDPYRVRLRGGSITTQTAGAMPDQPVPPPPPCAYPPNRFHLPRNDSSMRLSCLSLDTADSSILDGVRSPMVVDSSNFNSPALPPCPTFTPYSANDVGRGFSMSKSSLEGTFAFPPEFEGHRLEPDRTSPRRSMTARTASHSMERVSPPPRRSESLSANPPRKFGSRGNTPVLYPSANNIPAHWNGINYNTALLPHFSQMRRASLNERRQKEASEPYFSSSDALASSDGPLRAPPPSVLKGGNGPRKGHKRQNCVRISIHPPITFGGAVFSPTVEEDPGELEGSENRRSEVSELSSTNMPSLPSVSTVSNDDYNFQDRSRPPSYRRTSYNKNSPKKRKHARTEDTNNDRTLPEIDTDIPSRQASLSRTPSPDKSPPAWMTPIHEPSPTMRENQPAPGSHRISAVKGPRSQPGKPAGNNVQRSSMPLGENTVGSPTSSPHQRSSWEPQQQKPSQPLQRGDSNVTNQSSLPDRDAAEGLEVVSGPEPIRPLSPPSCGVSKTPSMRSGNIVTIWEDAKLERTPTKFSASSCPGEVIELQGDLAPTTANNENDESTIARHKSTGGIKEDDKSVPRTCKQQETVTTPVKKTVGLGIGAATPGSLYDGDGFLKE